MEMEGVEVSQPSDDEMTTSGAGLARRAHDSSPDSSPDRSNKRLMLGDGYRLVINGAKPKPPTIPNPTETHNRYQPLTTHDQPSTTSNTSDNHTDQTPLPQTTQRQPNQGKGRIGPFRIDLNSILDPTELTKDLMNTCGKHMTAKCTKTELLIQPMTVNAHTKIRDRLDEISTDPQQKGLFFTTISYHFNRATEEARDKFVIKGLPPKYSIDSIKQNLQQQNITNYHITEMQRRDDEGNLTPLGIYTVETNKKEMTNIKAKLTYIDYYRIRTENYKTTDRIPQCKNCQRLYHTKAYCRRTPTCALCAQDHPTENCPSHTTKDRSFTPKCTNCSQPHPAYDPSCPAIVKAKTLRQQSLKPTLTTTTPQFTEQSFPPLPRYSSYATATNPSQPNTGTQPSQSTAQDLKDLFSLLQNPSVKKILAHIKPLLAILKGPEDIVTKIIAAGLKIVEILN